MTNNTVTAVSVNERVDKMGRVFTEMGTRVNVLGELFASHVKPTAEEMTTLAAQMIELEKEIADTPIVERQAQYDLIDVRQRLDAAQERVSDIEAELFLNVCAELDDDGKKPIYTNDTQRKAALSLAITNSDEHKEARIELRSLEAEKARLEAQIVEVQNRCKNSRLFYRGYIARLENITARMTV